MISSNAMIIHNGKNQQYSKKIPYVELDASGDRLQGVVSSSSSHERVYVCVIDTTRGTYTCHTNNNRKCGGLRGGTCSHLRKMYSQATKIIAEDIQRFDPRRLRPDGKARYGEVFARFLNILRLSQILLVENQVFPEIQAFQAVIK